MEEVPQKHEHCINGKELQRFLIRQLEESRERYRPLEDKISEVGRAWFNAESSIWGKLNMFIDKLLKENQDKGVIDMEKLKQGLVVQKVKLEDLDLRRPVGKVQQDILKIIESELKELEDGEPTGVVLNISLDEHRNYYNAIRRMREEKLFENKDVQLKKDRKGRSVLMRYS